MKACWSRFGRPSRDRPARVVTDRPTALEAGVTHERTGSPLISTVQVPHWALPQPYLVPLTAKSCVNTASKEVLGSVGVCTGCPFKLKWMLMAADLVEEKATARA